MDGMENAYSLLEEKAMQKLAIYTVELILLGFTALLTLANPLVLGAEYVAKKVRARDNRRF